MPTLKKPEVSSYFHAASHTISHIVFDRGSRAAAIIDPVLDFDMKAGKSSTESADRIVRLAKAEGLRVEWILETHIHADHLTAAPYIKQKLGGKTGIGARVAEVQDTWNGIFNYKDSMKTEAALFDHLFEDGETFSIGGLAGRVSFTPGHTSADATYIVGDAAFVGDTLFMPDFGTARTDFPGGAARDLYNSIQKILELPAETRLFLCHDYLPEGRREHRWETTVEAQRRNIHLAGLSEDEFVALREARDKTLAPPELFYASLQINIRAGMAPPPEDNGVSYIKVPIA